MAAFDTSRTTYAAGQNRIGGFFAGLFGILRTWNDARITRKALVSLSDRELDDIGLVRGDIDAMTRR